MRCFRRRAEAGVAPDDAAQGRARHQRVLGLLLRHALPANIRRCAVCALLGLPSAVLECCLCFFLELLSRCLPAVWPLVLIVLAVVVARLPLVAPCFFTHAFPLCARFAHLNFPDFLSLAASKAFMETLTRSLVLDVEKFGIRIEVRSLADAGLWLQRWVFLCSPVLLVVLVVHVDKPSRHLDCMDSLFPVPTASRLSPVITGTRAGERAHGQERQARWVRLPEPRGLGGEFAQSLRRRSF